MLMIAACGGMTACGGGGGDASDAGQAGAPASDAVPVTAGIARLETLRDALVLPGQVAPSSATDWTVTAPGPGTVAELPVAEGDAVTAGDLLVRFDVLAVTQEVLAKQTVVTLAERVAEDARADATRKEELFGRGLIARNDLEASRSALGAAETTLTQARTELEIVQELQQASRVTARFDAVVVSVMKTTGDYVDGSTNDPVLRVVDPTRTQVVVELPVDQVGRLGAGQAAVLTAPATIDPIAATVARVDLPTDPMVRSAIVRLNYETPEPLPLDTPVRVEIVLDERANAVVVPAEAVLHDVDGAFVLLAGTDLIARRRAVRVGLVVGGLAQILQGLQAGERIVVGSADQVVDGQAILVSR